jgi:acetyltransferase
MEPIEGSDMATMLAAASDRIDSRPNPAAAWERSWHATNGTECRFRPIRPDDAERERAFILGLSEQSRYNRMMGSIREPAASLIERFVHPDYRQNMAFVALIGRGSAERIVAIARYAGQAPETRCEFAVAVTDASQGIGLGKALMNVLIDYARQVGMHELYGLVFPSNQRMLALARSLGMTQRRYAKDPSLVEVSRRL